jgi:hypothetical protein
MQLCNNGYAKAPQYYLTRTLHALVFDIMNISDLASTGRTTNRAFSSDSVVHVSSEQKATYLPVNSAV